VRALFDDLDIVDHDHIIGIADVAQAVGDEKVCPTLLQVVIIAPPPPFYYYNFSVPSKHTNNKIYALYHLQIVRRIEHGKTGLCRS
jgi:hypothetical protein